MTTRFPALLLLALSFALPASGQQSEMFGSYELFYSVVNTTFLDPEVAASYGITRGKKRAILNLAIREHVDDPDSPEPDSVEPTAARSAQIQGRTWDLIQNQTLEFREIREGPAIYYIAEFKFINEEWRFFEVDFRPVGADKTFTFKLKHQVFIN